MCLYMQSSDEDGDEDSRYTADQTLNKDQPIQSNQSAEEDKVPVKHKQIPGSISTF